MPIKISDAVGVGSNKVQITSVGERFCVVLKIMEELDIETTVKQVVEQVSSFCSSTAHFAAAHF